MLSFSKNIFRGDFHVVGLEHISSHFGLPADKRALCKDVEAAGEAEQENLQLVPKKELL